MNLEMFHSVV